MKNRNHPLVRMIADSDCHYCGGPVGSHSDMCLDCGREAPMPLDSWFLIGLFFALCALAVIASQ
jgi:hypothetical protein